MKPINLGPRLLLLALSILLTASMATAQANRPAQPQQAADQALQTAVQAKISSGKNLSAVTVTVDDRIARLGGSVPNLRTKLDAAERAGKVDGVEGVVNHIVVNAPSVPDAELRQNIANRLIYDRMGMGQTFNGFTLEVHNGKVVIGGQARDYPDRDSAVDIVINTKGVKDVVDNVQVAPLSPMDDDIRYRAAQAIYGSRSMLRYSNDPAKPIRILVERGRVTLVGVVYSQVDKNVAGNAVRSLPGVFSVKNDLVVANSGGQ